MITFNEKQKSRIKELRPLSDSKFKYNTAKWTSLNEDFKNLIKDFENKEITRKNIIDSYKEFFNDSSISFMKAFLLTMVWGFADTGYGTHRTNIYISSKDNTEKIKKALEYIDKNEKDSLQKSFEELKSIKGLGVSYLTKILYFATRAKSADNYALIFDIRVADSLIKISTPKQIYEIVNIAPSSKFKDYQKFNNLIHKMAIVNEVEADQIEMYLFNQDFE